MDLEEKRTGLADEFGYSCQMAEGTAWYYGVIYYRSVFSLWCIIQLLFLVDAILVNFRIQYVCTNIIDCTKQ